MLIHRRHNTKLISGFSLFTIPGDLNPNLRYDTGHPNVMSIYPGVSSSARSIPHHFWRSERGVFAVHCLRAVLLSNFVSYFATIPSFIRISAWLAWHIQGVSRSGHIIFGWRACIYMGVFLFSSSASCGVHCRGFVA
jgi:hypothetical protein